MLRELEVHGERLFSKLTIPDLQALLTNAEPQGNVTKPKNKTEGMARVRALEYVKAALNRSVLAVSVGDPAPI